MFVNVDVLQECGIACHQMKGQTYNHAVRTDESELFDLLITDPSYGTPKGESTAGTGYEKFFGKYEIKNLTRFSRRVAAPGGWAFILTSFTKFPELLEAMVEAGFSVPPFP